MFLDFNDSRHKVYGNASLHPETAHSFTLNYIQFNKLNKLGLSTRIEGFYNRINNKIELVVLGPIEATYNNIGVYETLGFALTERITYGDLAISTSLNYTGVYSGIAESERRFYFSPQIVITPSYHIKRLNMSVNAYLNYLGSFTRIFADTNSGVLSQEELDPYTTIDFSVRKQFFNKKIDVSAGFRNLLGVQNISATLTGVSAHTESTNSISISPGRTFFISIRYAILN
jgi:outer membrane receptor for ferrienterochelin and colicins